MLVSITDQERMISSNSQIEILLEQLGSGIVDIRKDHTSVPTAITISSEITLVVVISGAAPVAKSNIIRNGIAMVQVDNSENGFTFH